MFKNILSRSVPFVLLNLMAADGAEGGGGTPPPPQDPPTPPTEPQPEGTTVEAKLTSAVGHIKNLFGRVGQLTSQLATANNERTKLEDQFNAATGDLKTEKDAHAATKGLLSTANTQVTGLTTERDNANNNVARLETLCQLRGIDPNKAVTPAPAASAPKSMARGEFEKLPAKDQRAFCTGGGKVTD